jgi:hypothetical protein
MRGRVSVRTVEREELRRLSAVVEQTCRDPRLAALLLPIYRIGRTPDGRLLHGLQLTRTSEVVVSGESVSEVN